VARFLYGETSFLLTGDLPHEETVLPDEEPVTILKAAHHGSKYSTSEAFLDLVQPKEAVISVGKNSYGHPDSSVLERLWKRGIIVHRTDEEGALRYECLENVCNFAP
jgi:beta-lactamase superfamily II metal-dependent hydrolase